MQAFLKYVCITYFCIIKQEQIVSVLFFYLTVDIIIYAIKSGAL